MIFSKKINIVLVTLTFCLGMGLSGCSKREYINIYTVKNNSSSELLEVTVIFPEQPDDDNKLVFGFCVVNAEKKHFFMETPPDYPKKIIVTYMKDGKEITVGPLQTPQPSRKYTELVVKIYDTQKVELQLK